MRYMSHMSEPAYRIEKLKIFTRMIFHRTQIREFEYTQISECTKNNYNLTNKKCK